MDLTPAWRGRHDRVAARHGHAGRAGPSEAPCPPLLSAAIRRHPPSSARALAAYHRRPSRHAPLRACRRAIAGPPWRWVWWREGKTTERLRLPARPAPYVGPGHGWAPPTRRFCVHGHDKERCDWPCSLMHLPTSVLCFELRTVSLTAEGGNGGVRRAGGGDQLALPIKPERGKGMKGLSSRRRAPLPMRQAQTNNPPADKLCHRLEPAAMRIFVAAGFPRAPCGRVAQCASRRLEQENHEQKVLQNKPRTRHLRRRLR